MILLFCISVTLSCCDYSEFITLGGNTVLVRQETPNISPQDTVVLEFYFIPKYSGFELAEGYPVLRDTAFVAYGDVYYVGRKERRFFVLAHKK